MTLLISCLPQHNIACSKINAMHPGVLVAPNPYLK